MIILAVPFFFSKTDWIPVPEDWNPNIMQGKGYDTSTDVGRRLYEQVQDRLAKSSVPEIRADRVMESNDARYGTAQIIFPRIGQGTFKVIVTEAYHLAVRHIREKNIASVRGNTHKTILKRRAA